MPFSSLFNRKESRKNQSKDRTGEISKQNHPSEDGSTKEAGKSEGSREKNELSHADSTSQEGLKVEDKTCSIIESTQAATEASVPRDIQTEHSGDQTLSCDNQNRITDVENGEGPLKEDEIQIESDKNLSQANVNLCGGGNSEDSAERVEETGSDANRQEQQKSAVTYRTSVPISQSDGAGEGNQLDTRSCGTEEGEFVSEKLTGREESAKLKDAGITAHEDATEEIIASPSPKIQHSEDNDAYLDCRLEKNEGTEVKISDQENTLNTTSHTPTEELSNEEAVVFSGTNCSKEPQENEQEVNVLASESARKFYSVVANNHEIQSESFITNSSDNTNSVLPAKTASENEQLKDSESGNTEDEIEEKNNSKHILPPQEILSENNSIGAFSDSKKDDHVMRDSQRISDEEQTVATDIEKMEAQCGPSCIGREEIFEGTENSDEKVMSNRINKECEFENVSAKDFCNESSKDAEVRTEVRSSDMGATSGEDYSTKKSLNCGSAEHDTEKVQGNKIVSVPPLSVTSISSVISNGGCTDEISETQTVMDVTQQNRRNSGEREETKTNEVNDVDTNSRAENLENDLILVADETNDICCPQDCPISCPQGCADVPTVESASPLEDSFDSFPSGCEDFLGGQRTLMAAEQHPPPTWKVGYLQVKLPAKSRGRGKLKVWRQRWVVIQMDEFVKDTKNPSLMINIYASECSNARRHSALFFRTVSASKTVVYRSQSRTHKYAFSVSVDNDVILHLAADSETGSQEWMAAIRNLLWPPSPVLQLEKVLHGSDFEVSIIDNEFSFHAGLLGTYGNMKVTSNKLILSHPQTDHVIQEWYLNTLDKFQLLPQSKEEDAFKVVVMHTGENSSTGSGQVILFCPEAVTMLQSVASTIHKLLQYRTSSGKDHNQKELAELAEWLSPPVSPSSTGDPPEDYYKVPRRQIRSLLDIPNFSFEKPLSNEGLPQSQESVVTKPSMLTSATSASTFSEDSGISMAIQPDDFLNCSVTSFTIGGRPVRDHTSSESSDGYSPPCSPEVRRKNQETEAT